MRKTLTTLLASAAIVASSSAVMAGGLAPVAVAPTVFVEPDEPGTFGSLGGLGGLALAALVIGAAIALSDDDTEATDDDSSD